MKLIAEKPGRVDKLLAEALVQYSRSAITKLFEKGMVALDGMTDIKPGHKVREGAVIEIDTSLLEEDLQVVELPILYEDNDVVVIDKPTGVISHSRGKFWYEPSVASFIRWYLGPKNKKGKVIPNPKHLPDYLVTKSYRIDPNEPSNGDRSGIVHRLDRATSGVMICAKNETAMQYLQKQFANRTVKKTYMAILDATPHEDKAIIDAPIERNPKNPSIFRVGPHGKLAQTEYEVITKSTSRCLVEFKPRTGRTHQLRVHAQFIHCPILGDELYGSSSDRLYLHAHRLELTIPSGESKVFISPVPKEFKDAL